MSIPVRLADLAQVVTDYDSAYLLSCSADGQVKAITVDPVIESGAIRVPGPSQGTAENLAVNSAVTLLYPPLERHGYTLIVDGTARESEDGFDMTAETAVLHRPAAHADGPVPADGCGADCRRLA